MRTEQCTGPRNPVSVQTACLSGGSQAVALSQLGAELFTHTLPWRDRSRAIQGRASHLLTQTRPREVDGKGGRGLSVTQWVCCF